MKTYNVELTQVEISNLLYSLELLIDQEQDQINRTELIEKLRGAIE